MKGIIFVTGIVTGVYIAQNYKVPDIKTVFKKSADKFTEWEKNNKKRD